MFIPLTPLRCLHRAMDVFGSKTGIVSGNRRFTYAEFGERAERLANALPRFGISAGDRVAYLSFNNHQLIEGYYGVVQARGIVMPLNVRLSEVELTNILNHSGAKMLMFENDFAPMIEKLRRNCGAVERWVTLDDEIPCADLCYEELIAAGRPERADIFSYDESAIAELFYTSGSTGTPKGVTLAHRTLYVHALDVSSIYKDIDTMVDLHTIPMFHANGWGRPQASTLNGITQVMVRRFEPNAVFQLIEEHKATDMCLVPTMANALINCPDRGKYDLSSMRRVMIGGAASSPELADRVEKAIPGCECIAGYGLTETSPVLTSSRSKGLKYENDAERLRRQAMAGWPIPGVTVRVVDAEMKDVPRDMKSIGEVVAMGDHVMDGYFKDPEATAAVMSGPWFHTGDMAVWDEESYIHIVDRKKEIIISGGENISSLEVEREIFAHPAVLECAVVAAPNDQWGEVPAAIVVLKPGMSLTGEELIAFLSERLGKFKLPRIVEFSSDALPKTGTGKIRKMILKEKFWAGKEKRVQG
ncbi:MAG TPA: long-chain-fatty-acid--CoA ligase [Bryobacteraceae bacterium]|jgi:fatty-acyl-CoA synthase|nr:long-chain-fatty-acid--CoA ligase [Bryobacteraceae bacterium]